MTGGKEVRERVLLRSLSACRDAAARGGWAGRRRRSGIRRPGPARAPLADSGAAAGRPTGSTGPPVGPRARGVLSRDFPSLFHFWELSSAPPVLRFAPPYRLVFAHRSSLHQRYGSEQAEL